MGSSLEHPYKKRTLKWDPYSENYRGLGLGRVFVRVWIRASFFVPVWIPKSPYIQPRTLKGPHKQALSIWRSTFVLEAVHEHWD